MKPFIIYDEVADVPENILELYRSRLSPQEKAKFVFKEWKPKPLVDTSSTA